MVCTEAFVRSCSIKNVFLKISIKFTEKRLCLSLYFYKVAGLRSATLSKKRLAQKHRLKWCHKNSAIIILLLMKLFVESGLIFVTSLQDWFLNFLHCRFSWFRRLLLLIFFFMLCYIFVKIFSREQEQVLLVTCIKCYKKVAKNR